ncbi:hypothetical protein, partial [Thermoplasma sp.]|uniref:hypothetical protein n=1 Tax=Thermoplasma sp. TaxID=1973142 RepID=UPI0025E345A1
GNELAAVGKYLLVAAGVIGGIAIGYEALKAYQSHEYAKRYNPPPQYVINEAEQKALEYKPS